MVNSNKIEYRLIKSDDEFDQLSILYTNSWLKTYTGLIPNEYLSKLNYQSSKEKFINFNNQPNHFIYIAIDTYNNEICGMAASQLDEDKDEPETGLLYSLHVSLNHRGLGIGKELIKLTVSHFKIYQNITKLLLWAIVENVNAIKIYTHLGATIHKYQIEYYSNIPVNEVCLIWKDLNKQLL